MKKLLVFALVASAVIVSSCSSSKKPSSIVKGDAAELDTLSYAFGTHLGNALKSEFSDLPINMEVLTEAFETSALGNSKMTKEEASEVFMGYMSGTRMVRREIVARKRAQADSVKRANGMKESVVREEREALGADADMFESEEQRNEFSAALGTDIGLSFREADFPIQTYWVNEALVNGVNNASVITFEQAVAYIQNYFQVVVPQRNLEISNEKLAEIEAKSGVVKTESGLMYRVKSAGDEELRPSTGRDKVKVNYTGRLVRNNNVFDTSRYADRTDEQKEAMKKAGQSKDDMPVEFALNQVIKGWTEGLTHVGKGGRIELWIPASLAYGANGAGAMVGPNDAIYFDVEVIEVTLADQPKAESAE
ncbi:MAG: FKBP-type peptidyl-prolyl cis-trans isomerase N-terminal domain-containing protein [Rikenellaceae bacterium]